MSTNRPYELFEQLKDQLDNDRLFLEIGTSRDGAGSTQFLSRLAYQTSNKFVTVDVDPVLVNAALITKYTMSGEEFADTVMPTIKNRISLLLMDGFDWIQSPSDVRTGKASQDAYNLIEQYEQRHEQLNNVNSAVSHTLQLLKLRNHFADRCAVMFCETWFNWQLDTFEGKGAGGVYVLLADGFKVISADPNSRYILLGKGIMRPPGMPNLNVDALNKKYTGPSKAPNRIIYNE